jgi:hypothetical protein
MGAVPWFFDDEDPRPAAEQLNERYAHGGGFRPWGKEKWKLDAKALTIKWPGEKAMKPRAKATLHTDTLVFYDHAILAIIHEDGTFDVTRVD